MVFMNKKTSGLLNRDQLLQKRSLKIERVELEDGNHVFVRQMTGRERDIFEQSIFSIDATDQSNVKVEQKREDFRAKLAVVTICDEQGDLLLKRDDYDLLSQSMGARDLEEIVNVAQKLNKITKEDKEGVIKNSEAGKTGSSNLGSVGN